MQYKVIYRKLLTDTTSSPVWAGLMNNDRAYAPYTYNVEKSVPWRTLTGRQHSYLDHEMYIAYGEHLPIRISHHQNLQVYGDLRETVKNGEAKVLSCLNSSWKVAYPLNLYGYIRMVTLSRGIEPIWI